MIDPNLVPIGELIERLESHGNHIPDAEGEQSFGVYDRLAVSATMLYSIVAHPVGSKSSVWTYCRSEAPAVLTLALEALEELQALAPDAPILQRRFGPLGNKLD